MAGDRLNGDSDRRIFERFNVRLPTRFIDSRENVEGQAETYNVSAKGLGLLLDQEIKPNMPLELWLDLPDKGTPLYTRGRVIWTTQIEPRLWQTGVSLEKAELMGISRIFREPAAE
ncbi:MAG: PilZ domain-containing protein [Candidatus Omnitrophica bacterium]|nr:PilZ domain-containing protein [Candidatus Omnitrophota bacterium]